MVCKWPLISVVSCVISLDTADSIELATEVRKDFTTTEEVFFKFKAPSTAFTFKTLC